MTPEELILKSSLHFGIDVSVPSAFGKGAFQERCMTTYYAIKELHMPYKDLS
jgi:hypothetical protein